MTSLPSTPWSQILLTTSFSPTPQYRLPRNILPRGWERGSVVREDPLPCPHHHPILSLSGAPSDVCPNQPSYGRVTQWSSPYSVLGYCPGPRHAPQDDISPRVRCSTSMLLDYLTDHPALFGFPERNKVRDFSSFSSLLRITAKYEMPDIRYQLLEVVRDAYPEPSKG